MRHDKDSCSVRPHQNDSNEAFEPPLPEPPVVSSHLEMNSRVSQGDSGIVTCRLAGPVDIPSLVATLISTIRFIRGFSGSSARR